ncbi:MAG: hypothetical protein LBS61_03575 [Endomicrobium sp.]|jgi:hypothetical protein|nr:hypothetical protein [Endomicrobium sp.]
MKKLFAVLLAASLLFGISDISFAAKKSYKSKSTTTAKTKTVSVKQYKKKDGTIVKRHKRAK